MSSPSAKSEIIVAFPDMQDEDDSIESPAAGSSVNDSDDPAEETPTSYPPGSHIILDHDHGTSSADIHRNLHPGTAPSAGAGLEQNSSSVPPHDDIRKQFYVPNAAYIDMPGMSNIRKAWERYLETNNYAAAFERLHGTERDRYHPIIEQAKATEGLKSRRAFETMQVIQTLEPQINHMLYVARNEPPRQEHIFGNPNRSISKYGQYINNMLELKQGYRKLSEYLKRGLRYTRQNPVSHKAGCTTRYGILTACTILPREYWYAGHRPGDPIVRIGDNPLQRTFNDGHMFHVYDLAGGKDRDEPETYKVHFEGVVPFNTNELYERFTQHVFPKLVRMGIAAVGFDPRDKELRASPWLKQYDCLGFDEFTERGGAKLLRFLREIWHMKYGNNLVGYPIFWKVQLLKSICSLREMGWLISKLERDAPHLARNHYWGQCKGLFRDMAGREPVLLAQEYFNETLADESGRLLKEGKLDGILVYKQSRASREVAKVRIIFSLTLVSRIIYSIPLSFPS
ncbi:hypothetical protein GGS24DRAFT_458421 [Hypoxylon argillaceum]|nr:hypothetical protein GGS24DRAFT_458421 [Hypoxylon argillaceum]